MEASVKYIEISKGIKMGIPSHLTQEEIDLKIEKYKANLEKSKKQHYNPHKKAFVKSKF